MRASFITISASPSRWRMPREKVADLLVGDLLQADALERGGDPLVALGRGHAHQPRGVVQIVGGGEVVVEADRVRQIADHGA